MKAVQVYLPKEQKEKIQCYAKLEGVSMSAMVRHGLDLALEKMRQQGKITDKMLKQAEQAAERK